MWRIPQLVKRNMPVLCQECSWIFCLSEELEPWLITRWQTEKMHILLADEGYVCLSCHHFKKLRQELDSCVDANELLKEENDRLLKIIEQLNDKYYKCKHELNNYKADLIQARHINQGQDNRMKELQN